MDNNEKILKRIERIEDVLTEILKVQNNLYVLFSKYDKDYLTEMEGEHIGEG